MTQFLVNIKFLAFDFLILKNFKCKKKSINNNYELL